MFDNFKETIKNRNWFYKRVYYWLFTLREKKKSELVYNNIIFWGTLLISIFALINNEIYYKIDKEKISTATVMSAGTLRLISIFIFFAILVALWTKFIVFKIQRIKSKKDNKIYFGKGHYWINQEQYDRSHRHLEKGKNATSTKTL